MRKPRTGSRPSAVDPSPPTTPQEPTPQKPTKELLARFELLWWKALTWGQKEQLAGVVDRNSFWAGKTEAQVVTELRSLILQRVLLGEIELPKLSDYNRKEWEAIAASAVDKLAAKESEAPHV
jgi:hypothetical protein